MWILIFMVLTAVVGMYFVRKQQGKLWYVILAEVALLIRFALAFVIYYNGTETLGTDGLIYHLVAKNVANQLWNGVPVWDVEYKFTWYTVLVGIQYAVFGINRYAASFTNAFLAVLSGYFLTDIAVNLKFSYKKSAFIGLAYIFMPSMIVWTTDTRKESLTFFTSILLWYVVLMLLKEREWPASKRVLYISAVCVLLWVSTLLRIYMFVTLGGGILVCLFFHYLKTRRRFILYFGVIVLVFCAVIAYTTVYSNLNNYHAIPMNTSSQEDESIDNEVSTILDVIKSKNIPESINGFFTEPHLDNVQNISDIAGYYSLITLVRIEMLLWYACMIIALFGVLDCLMRWDPYLLGLLAYIASYSLINALVSENVADTYYRYRAAIVAPVLLFADYRPLLDHMKSIILKKSIINDRA